MKKSTVLADSASALQRLKSEQGASVVEQLRTPVGQAPLHSPAYERLAVIIALGCYLLVCIRTCWLGDDAYITFRSIDNFLNGYGLRWNPSERVQTYTHPLWMFVLTALHFIAGEVFYSTLIFSIAVSFCAVSLCAVYLASSLGAGLFAVIAFASSKAFVDYSSSGLENPLTHLLLVVFLCLYSAGGAGSQSRRRLFLLGLIASLAALNRADTILLYLPALLLICSKRPARNLFILAVSFTPLLLLGAVLACLLWISVPKYSICQA